MSWEDPSAASTVLSGEPVRDGATLGKYRLLKRLGVGGMAEVYLAEQEGPADFKKKVVVKRILPNLAADPKFVAMFVREAQVAARLHHSNVVQIYELGEQKIDKAPGAAEDAPSVEYFIAMELIDGLTLQRLAHAAWERGRAVPVDVVVRTAADAARGLGAAHALTDDDGRPLSLVHRDISPDNLMVSRDGITKVLDFGIAKGDLGGPKTKTGHLRGKIPYMAPEQVLGEPLDGRCDIYALGVSMYWLLCGERPFDRQSDFHTMQAVLTEAPKSPRALNPQVPESLERLILRMIEKKRDDRPKTANEVADELEEMASRGSGAGRKTTVAFVEEVLPYSIQKGNPLSEVAAPSLAGPPAGGTLPMVPALARASDATEGPAVAASSSSSSSSSSTPAPRQVTLPSQPEQQPQQQQQQQQQQQAAPDAAHDKRHDKKHHDPPTAVIALDPSLPTQAATGVVVAPPPPHRNAGNIALADVAPPPVSPTPPTSGSHPVVDMLAQPKRDLTPLIVVAAAAALLVIGVVGAWQIGARLLSSSHADAGTAATVDAGSAVVVADAGNAIAAAVDAGNAAAIVDAGNALAAVVDAGNAAAIVDAGNAAAVSDAGFVVDDRPKLPPGMKLVRARAPATIEWTLEDGQVLGRGTRGLVVPKLAARLGARDVVRGVSAVLEVGKDGSADYSKLPSGTIVATPPAGGKILLGAEAITGSIKAVAGSYDVRIFAPGEKKPTKRKVVVAPGASVAVP